jgi:hypothetical protein
MSRIPDRAHIAIPFAERSPGQSFMQPVTIMTER